MVRFFRCVYVFATAFEFLQATTLLALFAVAQSDQFRTSLWKDGGARGLNSDPGLRIYFYANHREPPPVALVWDESLTMSCLCFAVLTVFIWFLRYFVRRSIEDVYAMVFVNALYDAILAALWAYSGISQNSGDFSDPEHLSPKPWFLERGCRTAGNISKTGCEVMNAAYGLTVLTIIWFCARFLATCMYGAYLYGHEEESKKALFKREYVDLLI
ncbi:hypothetical protein P154DRAFT_527127 [Amniculicola lignicola CBS 123094]|uniref:MARVEL domain-containing protein n=1 Tax=Amniculicola lignicola CBS 123094 TaxID=1392246 RepID=A0A6A5W2D4_9PLEO|nr:hypothetical protein P154DRAFT_527127 [Amniculicola lignicola CBS 123094]